MDRVLVIGGHGRVARLLLPLLVASGRQVTALFRNPEHAPAVTAAGATALPLDIERASLDDLAPILADHDAIVWTAGAGGGDPQRTYAVDRDAAIRTMEAAAVVGTRRFVMVSYFGARTDHGIDPENPFFPYAEAKGAADEHLAGSSLEWTILGPSRLTDDHPTGRIETAGQGATAGSVSRADVAAVVVQALNDPATIGRTIRFNGGATPIAEALHD